MTTPTEPRDEQWLRALEARRDALDLRVPAADEAMLTTALGNPAPAASAGSLIRSTGIATIGFLRTSGRR